MIFLFFSGFKFLEYSDHATGINVRRRQIIPADVVRFRFVFLGKTLSQYHARTFAQEIQQTVPAMQEEATNQKWTGGRNDFPRMMFLGDVRRFVGDDADQFVVVRDLEQSRIHNDVTAGQGERIGVGRVRDVKYEIRSARHDPQ